MDNQYNYVDSNYNGGNNKNFGDVACIVGFSVAILTFCCDPLYIFSLVAIVFSILGICMGQTKKGFAIAGLIIVVVAGIWQIIFDILTMGIGFLF